MAFWESVKSWMGDGFSAFVYVAIVVLFIVGFMKCTLPVLETRRLLKRAVKSIRLGDKAKRSWQDDRFMGRGALYPHWTEYLNNLFFADGEYHNASNVEDYINEDTAITGPGRINLAEAVPGVLVSLGFLGTLMGLSVALANLNTGASDVVGLSITTLLDSMKYAFLTSIFGVVGSILFTLITRIVNGSANRALTAFYNAMSRGAGVISVDPMTQIAIYQQEQSGLLRKLTEEIGAGFAETVAKSVGDAIRPLSESMNNFMNIATRQQGQMLDSLADAYIRRLDLAMHGHIDMLTNTIENTCRYQEKTVREVSGALSAVGEMTDQVQQAVAKTRALTDKYDAWMSRAAQSQARSEEGARQMADMLSELKALLDGQGEAMARVERIMSELGKQSQLTVTATDAFMRNVDNLSAQVAAELTGAASELRRGGAELTEAAGAASEQLQKDMSESLNYFEDCLARVFEELRRASSSIRAAVETLPGANAGDADASRSGRRG